MTIANIKLIVKYIPYLIGISVFVLVICKFYQEITYGSVGVDVLWRVTEAKYVLMRINPFDIFMGKIPADLNIGKPAVYAPVSYLFMIPFTFVESKKFILYLYTGLDLFCLCCGIYIIRKSLNVNYDWKDALVLFIIFVSILRLDHIVYLNYGLISVFGLILFFLGQQKNSPVFMVLGIILVSLKPSLLLPLIILLIIKKNFFTLALLLFINIILISVVGVLVDSSILNLIFQMREAQAIFSANGFFRWEGILVVLKPFIGNRITLFGVVGCLLYIFAVHRYANGLFAKLTITVVASLTFFYNQEHAWIMVYPLIAYCIYFLSLEKKIAFIFFVLLIFMWMPSMYVQIESKGYGNYMSYHNLFRFSALLVVSTLLLKINQSRIQK